MELMGNSGKTGKQHKGGHTMATTTIQTIQTDPAYAALEAKRTSVAYYHARNKQDITHEMVICYRNGVNSDNRCKSCPGCTFYALHLVSPIQARIVINWVDSCLSDNDGYMWTGYYETDLSGIGAHVAHIAQLMVEEVYYRELGDMVYSAGMVHASQNGKFWPVGDKLDKVRNEGIWEYFIKMIQD